MFGTERGDKLRTGLWLLSVAGVIAIGLYYFPIEYKTVGFWESLYYTIRLFVFEHDLPSFPKLAPLIFIHFAAPALALSALWTALRRVLHLTPSLRIRWLSDHVVICGVGRTGKLLAASLKASHVPVVGVDLGPSEQFDEWSAKHRMPMVYGDFHSAAVLERAGAIRARAVIFASGDDLANLEGAIGLYDSVFARLDRRFVIWTHIANEKLAETARSAVRTRGPAEIRFFDTYHLAAERLVATYFHPEARKGLRDVTVLGFGKFGRDLVEVLVRSLAPSEQIRLHVIDIRDVERAVVELAKDLGVADRVRFTRGDIYDLALVRRSNNAFFLCTDDDLGNLTGALMLARHRGPARVYVRMATWPMPAMAERLGDDCGVTFININELMERGISTMPGVFSPLVSGQSTSLPPFEPERESMLPGPESGPRQSDSA